MSVTPKNLISAQYANASAINNYVAPQNTTTIIDKFTVTNITGSSATLTVCLVPNGQSAASTNTVISALSVGAGATTDITELQNQILSSGEAINCQAGTGSALVIRASGREVA